MNNTTLLRRSNGRYTVTAEKGAHSWVAMRRFNDGTWTVIGSFRTADEAIRCADAEMPASAVHPCALRKEPVRRADGLLVMA